jgi:hypothetical protein
MKGCLTEATGETSRPQKKTSSISKQDIFKTFFVGHCLPVSRDPVESESGSATLVTREEKDVICTVSDQCGINCMRNNFRLHMSQSFNPNKGQTYGEHLVSDPCKYSVD